MCCINCYFIFCWEVKFRMDFKSLKLIIPFTTNTTPPRKTTYCLQVTYLVESEIKVIKNLPYKPRSSHNWTFSLLPQYEETRKNDVTSRQDAGQILVHHFSPPPPLTTIYQASLTLGWYAYPLRRHKTMSLVRIESICLPRIVVTGDQGKKSQSYYAAKCEVTVIIIFTPNIEWAQL